MNRKRKVKRKNKMEQTKEENKIEKENKKKEIKVSQEKLNDLKIELLRQVQKRKGIKKEIARVLTLKNKLDSDNRIKEKK